MGNKIFKLFMDTMLRAAVIVLGIGVIIMLALLIKSMVSNKNAKNDKTTENVQSISTEEEDPDDPTFGSSDGQSTDGTADGDNSDEEETAVSSVNAKVLIINATGTSGVAGSWKTTLEGYGYTSVDVGNYSLGTITTTKVCVSGDYDGADIAEYYTSPEMTTISTLQSSAFDMPIEDYDIVVVVGTTDVQR